MEDFHVEVFFEFQKNSFTIIFVAISFLCSAFLDTNSVMRYAKSVFRGEIALEEVVDSPMYMRYYPRNEPELDKVDLNLYRIFVLHDFSDGYIWIKYDVAYIDSSGYEFSGSRNVPARWKIHKENGEWKVVEIKESP